MSRRTPHLFPILADYLAAAGRNPRVLHATRGHGTIEALCGVTRPILHVYGVRAPLSSGGEAIMAMEWPPPAKHGDSVRCRECWELTGKPRPASSWKQLREAS